MGYMPVPKLVVTMALPLMFSLLVQSLYNIVDGIFVARLSEKALTATSLAYPIQLLMVAVSVGTAVGLNAYLSRTVGEKNYKKATLVADTGLVLIIICALVFAVLGALFADTFANMFTDDAELAAMCGTYLQICMLFCAGAFVQIMAQRFLQAAGDTGLSMLPLII
ncbi:MAG: MATE family efflux transporter, partial [Candidatus Ornithomonoglobus sp.]